MLISVIDVVDELRHVLVAVEISTCWPARAARQASVPMTSSASTPSTRSSGQTLRAQDGEQRLDLRAQVVRHRRAVRLVLREDLVAEGLPQASNTRPTRFGA